MKTSPLKKTEGKRSAEGERLAEIVARVGHLLPDQGPLQVFIHHNTAHAFQHLEFHDAVVEAAKLYRAEPYLSEARFRTEYASGRINDEDLAAALETLKDRLPAEPPRLPLPLTRIRMAMLGRPIVERRGAALRFALDEEGAIERFQPWVDETSRTKAIETSLPWLREHGEYSAKAVKDPEWAVVDALWRHTLHLITQMPVVRPIKEDRPARLSDYLLAATGADADRQMNGLLIPLTAAYFDFGMANWELPNRERGFFNATKALFSAGPLPPVSWLASLHKAWRHIDASGLSAGDIALEVLRDFGVTEEHWEAFMSADLLALKGWSGMVSRLERMPTDRPKGSPPASLMDFVAVRLVIERAALRDIADRAGFRGVELSTLSRQLHAEEQATSPNPAERAFVLFQVFQALGLGLGDISAYSSTEATALCKAVSQFDELWRRRVYQEAYEHHHRVQIVDAVRGNLQEQTRCQQPTPKLQFICCFDEREESLRRHLEEIDPAYETIGAAGFFALPISYKGIDDYSFSTFCPVILTPQRTILEEVLPEHRYTHTKRTRARRRLGRLLYWGYRGSRSLFAGLLWTVFGLFSMLPMASRILIPRTAARWRRQLHRLVVPAPQTKLAAFHEAQPEEVHPHENELPKGFEFTEAARRLGLLFNDTGYVREEQFAPLIVVLGHGATSVNNPLLSAYNCGACGGHHGEASARLFAAMGNHPTVRGLLRKQGITIPETTRFVGGMHDTTNCAITLSDVGDLPASHHSLLREGKESLDRARMMSAHERCRRFLLASPRITPAKALRHVEDRSDNLAEPRPEYGHCTNAIAIVGRRSISRNLFLDRRAFLISYDPFNDPTGEILERLSIPVCVVGGGISLEYYFSCVDNETYGSGTKLPHNIIGLFGVMNGHLSDLRTGLTRQMVEIHEPVRLLVIIESTPEILVGITERKPIVKEFVRNRWIQLICINPHDGSVTQFTGSGFVPYSHAAPPVATVPDSRSWYEGHREHLAPVRVAAGSWPRIADKTLMPQGGQHG